MLMDLGKEDWIKLIKESTNGVKKGVEEKSTIDISKELVERGHAIESDGKAKNGEKKIFEDSPQVKAKAKCGLSRS